MLPVVDYYRQERLFVDTSRHWGNILTILVLSMCFIVLACRFRHERRPR